MDQFTDVYETMLGLREHHAQVSGIEDAFAEGTPCANAYEQMRGAYERICQRLGVINEDPDLDAIVENMEVIQKELCFRMYTQNERGAADVAP